MKKLALLVVTLVFCLGTFFSTQASLADGRDCVRRCREEAHQARHHAVRVLVEDAADHGRHQHAVGERPVRHREPGAGARHEAADENEGEGGGGGGDAEAVPPAIEARGVPEGRRGRDGSGTPRHASSCS